MAISFDPDPPVDESRNERSKCPTLSRGSPSTRSKGQCPTCQCPTWAERG